MKTPIRPLNWSIPRLSREEFGEMERADALDPELAVRVSHPEALVEQLFVAAWRPLPNPGGLPWPEEVFPLDEVLIGELRSIGKSGKDGARQTEPEPSRIPESSFLQGDCWGDEVAVSRPQFGVGRSTVFTTDVEREYFVGLLRDKDIFLLVRADRDGRVSIPLESPAGDLTTPAITARARYLLDTALNACRLGIPGFSHSECEQVAGKPDDSLRPFIRPWATRRYGRAFQSQTTASDVDIAAAGGAALARASTMALPELEP